MELRVVPYNQTMGCEKYYNFLTTPFSPDMLYPTIDETVEILFDGWRGKDMLNWYKYTNEDKVVLEFYPTYYSIRKSGKNEITYMMSIPLTIDDFINDMTRFGVKLYWSEWIDGHFEPKSYLASDEIKSYFVDLLGKMNKSYELL